MAYTVPETWDNELVTSAKWTTELKTNLLAIKDPPSQNYEANEGTDYTHTGGAWVDIDADFNFSITTTGGDVFLSFIGYVTALVSVPAYVVLDVSVDGTRIINQDDAGLAIVLSAGLAQFTYMVTGLSAGVHTFNLQWTGYDGTTAKTLYAGAGTASFDIHPQFWAREVS